MSVDPLTGRSLLGKASAEAQKATVRHLVGLLFDDTHYRKIHKMMALKWDKYQSLSATMKLMEKYGVVVSAEEEQAMSGMDEATMIDCLVQKMPQQSKEQFQEFFLQLQLIVSTAMRVRQALEEGNAVEVENVLAEAFKAGVAQYILKMAVVQGGAEVEEVRRQHKQWIKEIDIKMCGLLRGQEESLLAKKALEAARAKLAEFTGSHTDKAKKILMSMASGNSQALLVACFHGWRDEWRQLRRENEIRAEYEDQIQAAVKRLNDYREKQLSGVRSVLMRKAADGDAMLVQECFKILHADVEEKKMDKENDGAVRDIEAKLAAYASSQAENTKKVMARMSAGSDDAMKNLCLQAWISFCAEYRKDKEQEDAVKKAEQDIQKFLKSKSENAIGVLDRMSDGNDTALLSTVLGSWTTLYLEEKKSNEMAELLNGGSSKFGSFRDRNAGNAQSAMARQTQYIEHMLYLRCINAWRLHTQLEKVISAFGDPIDVKKKQLKEVQNLFQSFATRLDDGLKDGTPRDPQGKCSLNMSDGKISRKLVKNEHTCSLPDLPKELRKAELPLPGDPANLPLPPPPPPPRKQASDR